MSNHLSNETSLYLKDYINSKVHWYPYGDQAFQRAKEEKKPIFLSIGYSGSHWCHIMKEESFEQEEIAQRLNKHFIAIKVDKDERTDLDKYYKQVYKLMNGQACSSPISLFLTEDRAPFYAAAYIGTTPRGNVLDFRTLLDVVIQKYHHDKKTMVQKGEEVLHYLQPTQGSIQATRLNMNVLKTIKLHAQNLFDATHGGFGTTPKFLQLSLLDLLLEAYQHDHDPDLLSMVTFSLDKMIQGEIHDHDNGGFFHYANQASWSFPRQEKMLYDNAYMVNILLKTNAITSNPIYQKVAFKTLDYLIKNFSHHDLFGSNAFAYQGEWKVDPKIVTSFNAMMITALLDAGKIERHYHNLAIKRLDQLLQQLQGTQLYHTSTIPAFLDDYAYLAYALLHAHNLTQEPTYLAHAEELANQAIGIFYTHGRWKFSQTIPNLYDDIHDPLYPSAIATMLILLQDLSWKIESDYTPIVFKTLEFHSYNLMRQPLSSPKMSTALLRHLKKML